MGRATVLRRNRAILKANMSAAEFGAIMVADAIGWMLGRPLIPVARAGRQSSASVGDDLQFGNPAEAGCVCREERKLVPERARGDPEIIRAKELSPTPQLPGQSTVGQSRFFVDGQEDAEISHRPQNRVIGVLEALRELPERDARKKELDLGVLCQKSMGLPLDARATFALQIYEERRVDAYSSGHGSSGGRSSS